MSDEQLGLTLKETTENLFRLRLQAQTERLDAPSELRKQRRLIARDQDDSNAARERPCSKPASRARQSERLTNDMPKRAEIGVVTSDKMAKTRRVEIPRLVQHPKYGKYMRRKTVCYVHDENNESHMGDTVEIVESRPLSRTEALGAGAGGGQEQRGRHRRDACGGEAERDAGEPKQQVDGYR